MRQGTRQVHLHHTRLAREQREVHYGGIPRVPPRLRGDTEHQRLQGTYAGRDGHRSEEELRLRHATRAQEREA